MLIFTRPYQAIQLIAVSSGGGTIPLFPALVIERSVIRFPLHFERQIIINPAMASRANNNTVTIYRKWWVIDMASMSDRSAGV